MVVVQARAKAEAAKARAAFEDKEIELKIKTARLQATLEALQEEKEMNAAIAEAEILEAGLLEADRESQKSEPSSVLLNQWLQRTANYVNDQARVKSIHQPATSDDKGITFYPPSVVGQPLLEPDIGQHNQQYQTPGGVPPQQPAAPKQQWYGIQYSGHSSQLGASQPCALQPQ